MAETANDAVIADAATDAPAPTAPHSTTDASDPSTNTAPVVDAEREAFRRLHEGQSVQDVQRDLQSRSRAASTKPAPTTEKPAVATKGPATTEGEASNPTPGQAKDDYGLTEKELNALRRDKFDLSLLSSMPLTNRKAVARSIASKLSEQDRLYQATRAGKAPAPGAAPDDGNANPIASPTDEQPTEPVVPPAKPAPVQKQQAASPPAVEAPPAQGGWKVPDSDLATLKDIGGEEFANVTSRLLSSQAAHYEQQIAQRDNVLGFVMDRFERQDFETGLAALKKTPGMENLTDEQTSALRDKAKLLVRAAADPASYTLVDAVADAAASLFRTNVQQRAQADLITRRNQSLKTSPERAAKKADVSRPISDEARMKAVLDNLKNGMSVQASRDAADAL